MSADEFDPSQEAARAVGDLVEDSTPSAATSSTSSSSDSDDETSSSEDSSIDLFRPLLETPSRGPGPRIWREEYNLDDGPDLIMSGLSGWVAGVFDLDVGDALPPLGEITLGAFKIFGFAGSGDSSSASSDGEADRGDDEPELDLSGISAGGV